MAASLTPSWQINGFCLNLIRPLRAAALLLPRVKANRSVCWQRRGDVIIYPEVSNTGRFMSVSLKVPMGGVFLTLFEHVCLWVCCYHKHMCMPLRSIYWLVIVSMTVQVRRTFYYSSHRMLLTMSFINCASFIKQKIAKQPPIALALTASIIAVKLWIFAVNWIKQACF